jgi:hypothetical protein
MLENSNFQQFPNFLVKIKNDKIWGVEAGGGVEKNTFVMCV